MLRKLIHNNAMA